MAGKPAAIAVAGGDQRLIVRPRVRLTLAAASLAVMTSATVEALEIRITRLRMTGPRLWAAVEVRDLLRDRFQPLVRGGRAIFLQLEADFWEDRRIVDRMVIATPPLTWRIDGDADGRGVLVHDQDGGSLRHPDPSQPIALRIDIGPAARVNDVASYYLHASLTAASVDERDIDQVGEAIFGGEGSGRGLAALGRFVFRSLLRMGRYFETATAETTSRRLSGSEIRSGAF